MPQKNPENTLGAVSGRRHLPTITFTQTNAKEVQQIDAGSRKDRLENKNTENKTTKGEQYTRNLGTEGKIFIGGQQIHLYGKGSDRQRRNR